MPFRIRFSVLDQFPIAGVSLAREEPIRTGESITVVTRADPCRLARQVNKSCERRGVSSIASGPLPACLAGERVFCCGRIIATKTPSPAARGGRGRRIPARFVPSLKKLVHRPGKLAGVASILRQLLIRLSSRGFAHLPPGKWGPLVHLRVKSYAPRSSAEKGRTAPAVTNGV